MNIKELSGNYKVQFWLFFVILLLLSFFMMDSYYPHGELRFGHDLHFHLQRLDALMEAIKNNSFPVYLDHNAVNGYGYATKWFYPDVLLIPFAIIGNLTDLTFAYKSMLFTMSMLCGIFTYLAVIKTYKSSFAAIICALLYTFCIYRLLDLFERGALGEVMAFTFVPLVIWGLYEIVIGNYRKWYIFTIGYSLIIFSHFISSVLMAITVVFLLLFYIRELRKEPRRLYILFIAGLVTVVITVCYWLPMLEQMSSNNFYYQTKGTEFVRGSGLPLRMIIRGLFAGFIPPASTFSVEIGILLTSAVCLRFAVWRKSEFQKSIDVGVVVGVFFILLCTTFFPWWVWPFNKLGFIQAPWRLFIFVSYFFALAGGYYLSRIIKMKRYRYLALLVVVVCTAFILINESNSYKSKSIVITPTSIKPTFINNYHLGGLEYIPSRVPSARFIDERGDKIIVADKSAEISDIEWIGDRMIFKVSSSDSPGKIELPFLYYKGYTAILNGDEIPVNQSPDGLVELDAGTQGNIAVYYEGTFIQKFSYYLTLFSIIFFGLYIGYSRRKNRIVQK